MAVLCQDTSTSTCKETQEGEEHEEVFISIQAFPALVDITQSCEVSKISCGSRHTAAVTSKNTPHMILHKWIHKFLNHIQGHPDLYFIFHFMFQPQVTSTLGAGVRVCI